LHTLQHCLHEHIGEGGGEAVSRGVFFLHKLVKFRCTYVNIHLKTGCEATATIIRISDFGHTPGMKANCNTKSFVYSVHMYLFKTKKKLNNICMHAHT